MGIKLDRLTPPRFPRITDSSRCGRTGRNRVSCRLPQWRDTSTHYMRHPAVASCSNLPSPLSPVSSQGSRIVRIAQKQRGVIRGSSVQKKASHFVTGDRLTRIPPTTPPGTNTSPLVGERTLTPPRAFLGTQRLLASHLYLSAHYQR